MHIVDAILQRMGGPTAISKATGFAVQTIHSWTKDPKNIPVWRRSEIASAAHRMGSDLTPEMLAYLASATRVAA